MERFQTDADRLAEGFLIAECIWDPSDKDSYDGESLHPELMWHMTREAFERGDFTLRFWRDNFYQWHEGRYRPVSDSDMRCRLKRHLHEHNRNLSLFDGTADQHVEITTSRLTNILMCVAGTEGVFVPESRSLNTWDDHRERIGIQTLPFANGQLLFDKSGGKPALAEPTPHYFSLTKLPYDYDPQAECPRWWNFLHDVMDGDIERIDLLRQWAGYVLTSTSNRQKFMLIASDGRNGRTVFTTVLERMVGVENVSHIPLSLFSQPFALAPTLGKVLNSTSESCHGLDEMAETMLNSYVHWCHRNGYRPMNAANFGKEVKRTLPGVRNERIRDRGRRIMVYQGMAVKEGSEVATEPCDTVHGGHRNF